MIVSLIDEHRRAVAPLRVRVLVVDDQTEGPNDVIPVSPVLMQAGSPIVGLEWSRGTHIVLITVGENVPCLGLLVVQDGVGLCAVEMAELLDPIRVIVGVSGKIPKEQELLKEAVLVLRSEDASRRTKIWNLGLALAHGFNLI